MSKKQPDAPKAAEEPSPADAHDHDGTDSALIKTPEPLPGSPDLGKPMGYRPSTFLVLFDDERKSQGFLGTPPDSLVASGYKVRDALGRPWAGGVEDRAEETHRMTQMQTMNRLYCQALVNADSRLARRLRLVAEKDRPGLPDLSSPDKSDKAADK